MSRRSYPNSDARPSLHLQPAEHSFEKRGKHSATLLLTKLASYSCRNPKPGWVPDLFLTLSLQRFPQCSLSFVHCGGGSGMFLWNAPLAIKSLLQPASSLSRRPGRPKAGRIHAELWADQSVSLTDTHIGAQHLKGFLTTLVHLLSREN